MPRGGKRPGAGRPPGRNPEMSAVLYVRCKPAELLAWQAGAEAQGFEFSEWVRRRLTQATSWSPKL